MTEETAKEEIPVTLKVMRLYAPKLQINAVASASALLDYNIHHDEIPTSSAPPLPFDVGGCDALTNALLLPEDFGYVTHTSTYIYIYIHVDTCAVFSISQYIYVDVYSILCKLYIMYILIRLVCPIIIFLLCILNIRILLSQSLYIN